MTSDPHIDSSANTGVVAWRERRLEEVGFDKPTAFRLACDCGLDLHDQLALVDAGCPPHLAVRILAPIAGGRLPC